MNSKQNVESQSVRTIMEEKGSDKIATVNYHSIGVK